MLDNFEYVIGIIENDISDLDKWLLKLRVNNPKHKRKIDAINALKQECEKAIKKLES